MYKHKKIAFERELEARYALKDFNRSYIQYIALDPDAVFEINVMCYLCYSNLRDSHSLRDLTERYDVGYSRAKTAVSYFEKVICRELSVDITHGLLDIFGVDNKINPIFTQPVSNVRDEIFKHFMETAFTKEAVKRYLELKERAPFIKNLNDRLMNESVKQVDYLLRLRKYEPGAE